LYDETIYLDTNEEAPEHMQTRHLTYLLRVDKIVQVSNSFRIVLGITLPRKEAKSRKLNFSLAAFHSSVFHDAILSTNKRTYFFLPLHP